MTELRGVVALRTGHKGNIINDCFPICDCGYFTQIRSVRLRKAVGGQSGQSIMCEINSTNQESPSINCMCFVLNEK